MAVVQNLELNLRQIAGSILRFGASAGNQIKSIAGGINLRDSADANDVNLVAAQLQASSPAGLVLNSAAPGSAGNFKTTLQAPNTGMTAANTLTLPATLPTAQQALVVSPTGVMSYQSMGSTPAVVPFTFSSTTLALITLNTGNYLLEIDILVTTAFAAAGTATIQIGVAGTLGMFIDTSFVDLYKTNGVGVFQAVIDPSQVVISGSTPIIITVTPGSPTPTAGAGLVIAKYI